MDKNLEFWKTSKLLWRVLATKKMLRIFRKSFHNKNINLEFYQKGVPKINKPSDSFGNTKIMGITKMWIHKNRKTAGKYRTFKKRRLSK